MIQVVAIVCKWVELIFVDRDLWAKAYKRWMGCIMVVVVLVVEGGIDVLVGMVIDKLGDVGFVMVVKTTLGMCVVDN